jgi:hypothetical protein
LALAGRAKSNNSTSCMLLSHPDRCCTVIRTVWQSTVGKSVQQTRQFKRNR